MGKGTIPSSDISGGSMASVFRRSFWTPASHALTGTALWDAAALEELILQTSDGTLTHDQIRTAHVAENWEGLLAAIREGYFRHDREKVIRILSDSSIGDETRKWRLRQLDGGYTWNFLYRRYLPVLRQAVITGISYSSFTPLAACRPTEQMSVRAHLMPENIPEIALPYDGGEDILSGAISYPS